MSFEGGGKASSRPGRLRREVEPQGKIKAVAIGKGNGCLIVEQQRSNAKEDDYISFFSFPLSLNMYKSE